MKKILVIDESPLFLDYITKKLLENGFDVVQGKNGLDGSVKMRSELPDLIVMDYYLSRKSSIEVLKEKKENPNVSSIPLIMLASKLDRAQVVQSAQFGAKRFFTKPVRIDGLLHAISELLNVDVEIDTTPCIIEAHLNDEILFIELARGLNLEKIELLKYKIAELLDLYDIKMPRVLLMMSDIELGEDDADKFKTLLDTIIEHSGAHGKRMKILTTSDFVRSYIGSNPQYSTLGVSDNLTQAMTDLVGLRLDDADRDEVVSRQLLSTSAPKKEKTETFQLRFDAELVGERETGSKGKKAVAVAVVDDDVIIQQLVKTVYQKAGWDITAYNNGKEFVDDLPGRSFDLVYLDLMMPEMDGYKVLEYLNAKKIKLSIIVLSALTQQEAVVRAMKLGVHSYLGKPFKPEMLIRKTAELLSANF
ncbi:MAG: response regulator [Spirochaetales bacterium]|nr:response regulator [Spirochaetales bacterium]